MSYGKSKSDELCGVAILFVFWEFNANGVKIRNSRDINKFCAANVTWVEEEAKMLSCHFIWLKDEDLEGFRANTVDDDPGKITGIRKLHQVITKH